MKKQFAYLLVVFLLLLKIPGEVYHYYEHNDHASHSDHGLAFGKEDCSQCLFGFLDVDLPVLELSVVLKSTVLKEYEKPTASFHSISVFHYPVRGSPDC